MADEMERTDADVAETAGHEDADERSGRWLPPEAHINRLNEENARRRVENETLRSRVAVLERRAREAAVSAARRGALEGRLAAAAAAGLHVDAERLRACVDAGHLAVALDIERDVEVSESGEAVIADAARERLDAAAASAVELVSHPTTVVAPPRPGPQPPADRRADGAPDGRFSNAWDTRNAVSLGDQGRKELRDAALGDDRVQDALDRL